MVGGRTRSDSVREWGFSVFNWGDYYGADDTWKSANDTENHWRTGDTYDTNRKWKTDWQFKYWWNQWSTRTLANQQTQEQKLSGFLVIKTPQDIRKRYFKQEQKLSGFLVIKTPQDIRKRYFKIERAGKPRHVQPFSKISSYRFGYSIFTQHRKMPRSGISRRVWKKVEKVSCFSCLFCSFLA